MLKMMILILSSVLCVSAYSHHALDFLGCSDSDGEEMFSLDGEEVWYADFNNKRGVVALPSFVHDMTFDDLYHVAEINRERCRRNLKFLLHRLVNISFQLDPPYSPIIYPKDEVELGQMNVLICHATGFFPPPVNISWTKNGEEMLEGTTIKLPFPNKDGSFNQFSTLEFIPQQGDIYSCTLKHQALDQPLTRFWDVEKPQPSIGPSVFCGLGLTVGLIGVAVGTFFLIKGNECG